MPLLRDCWAHSPRKDIQCTLTHRHVHTYTPNSYTHTQHLQRTKRNLSVSSQTLQKTARAGSVRLSFCICSQIIPQSPYFLFLASFTQICPRVLLQSRTCPLSPLRGVLVQRRGAKNLPREGIPEPFLNSSLSSHKTGVECCRQTFTQYTLNPCDVIGCCSYMAIMRRVVSLSLAD